MEIRSLQSFGVEVVGCDLSDATDDDVRRIYDAMESDDRCDSCAPGAGCKACFAL